MTTIARFDFVDDEGEHKNDIRWDPQTGSFAMCEGLDAYAQTIEAVVKTVYGEIITRRNYGIPYFSTVFNNRIYAREWASAVTSAVSELDFVVSIDDFQYEYDTNRKCMTYTLSVTTTDGTPVTVAQE